MYLPRQSLHLDDLDPIMMTSPPSQKLDIRTLDQEGLKAVLASVGEPSFRARQIEEWLWKKSAMSFDEMTNLSKNLRTKLAAEYEIRHITLDKYQQSLDGTVKFRFRLYDGAFIESVLIPVPAENRFTVCVSTQVGCSLTCSFCATGKMKRVRNLDPGEIYDQFVLVNRQCQETFGYPLSNVVYMGMGEPLLNYKNTLESIRHICSPEGLHFSAKRITISTAGIAKMIRQLADDGVKCNLALSLHAADDAKRNEVMPINEQNDLRSLMDALGYFYRKTKNKISFEYIAFQEFNDFPEDAEKLATLCGHFPVTVNIIEYNPVEGVEMTKSNEIRLNRFLARLSQFGVMATVRRSRGKDIDAACGQLANKG